MSAARLTLKELSVIDGSLPPATITFSKGLNLIVGASDTGKTFIFEAIDYMLGAKGPLRRIPSRRDRRCSPFDDPTAFRRSRSRSWRREMLATNKARP
jgi:DNA repair ATPase RecN